MNRRYGFMIAGAVVAVVVLPMLWWGFRVATSDIRGQGNAVQTKNSAPNRIAAQERFEDMHQAVLAADKRIDVLAAGVKAHPGSQVAQTNYLGAVTFCQQAVADYNAAARKYTSRDFRAFDLPQQIEDLDPTTDCKETVS